jgi:hypothetical protein
VIRDYSIHFSFGSLNNWGFGIDYFHDYDTMPYRLIARMLVINLIVFRFTITRWEKHKWI